MKKHLISCKQYDNHEQLETLFGLTAKVNKPYYREDYPVSPCAYVAENKIMATLFYEPSTRTRFSFEAAMHKLGGNVISSDSAGQFSSHAKGESLEDTIKVVSQYADVIVLRHPEKGAAQRAASVNGSTIINAGDGDGEHPTQALLDLYTIKKRFNKIDGLRVALVGDLTHSRTIHSLIYLLTLYKDMNVLLCSPKEFSLPEEHIAHLLEKRVKFAPWNDVKTMLREGKPDVIYLTRLQKERLDPLKKIITEHQWMGWSFGQEELELAKEDAIIMHPLPRLQELSTCVDKDKKAVYLTEQIKCGLEVRTGLLYSLFYNNTI